jgi:predicted glycogen debranching enzyme
MIMGNSSTQEQDSLTRAINPTEPIDKWLTQEWLLTNGTGSYSSGTLAGINTRRYHGLLIAATKAPLGRVNVLAGVGETLSVEGQDVKLYGWEFANLFHPGGFNYLKSMQVGSDVRMLYEVEDIQLEKTISLVPGKDILLVRYQIKSANNPWSLELTPFVALRNFHSLRSFCIDDQMVVQGEGEQISVHDRLANTPRLYLRVEGAEFAHGADWWYRFRYRGEAQRGQDCFEDLFVPGAFVVTGCGEDELVLAAFLNEQENVEPIEKLIVASTRSVSAAGAMPTDNSSVRRLISASETFIASRRGSNGQMRSTILAGFHWFGDWGRDAFIALPGLLLLTEKYDRALEVFETFAEALSEGMIPNCFNESGGEPAYNSVDASLWFVHAADLYLQASGDDKSWQYFFKPVICKILDAYEAGTRFGIHADENGLIVCGDDQTQITWMDTQYNGQCFTPRPGAAVEINALWYSVLKRIATRLEKDDRARVKRYLGLAQRVGKSLSRMFWNEQDKCLYDYVWQGKVNTDIRPNQIFAVSLPHSPLNKKQQKSVVDTVRRHLLTPFGLRSLSDDDPKYRSHYTGDLFSRDSAYHQGTVWSWLIGPFVEAYLRVHNFSSKAREEAQQMIGPLLEHLDDAGVGFVSEVFDGDPPHRARGCIAQAWSVAELLRAQALIHS